MKVGDLTKLSIRKTRKGLPYESKIGLITKVHVQELWGCVDVNFGGVSYRFKHTDLEVVSACR